MAVSRTVDLHHRPAEWKRLQTNGMKADFSWGASGAAYAALYRQLIEEQA
jgi:starch synthase